MSIVLKRTPSRQLELSIDAERQPDRNLDRGGRSFYFFDFDDNVMFLGTSIFLFDRSTGEQRALSTAEYAAVQARVGKPGPWARYALVADNFTGSFRRFRDHPRPPGGRQPFVEDLATALGRSPEDWMGPSWDFFWYAVHNQRPIAIITARGHHPDTIREGIALLHRSGHLTALPNYLSIFPVTNPEVRERLGPSATVPALKRAAIVASVEAAMRTYGRNPYHRFGMSDDDPQNIELIIEAMRELKRRHPDNCFFVIDAQGTPLVKTEIFSDSVESEEVPREGQLALFR